MAHKPSVPHVPLRATLIPRLRGVWLFLFVMGVGWLDPTQAIFLLDYVPTPIYAWDWSHYIYKAWIRVVTDGLMYLLGYVWGSKLYLGALCAGSLALGYRRADRIRGRWFAHEKIWHRLGTVMIGMLLFVANPVYSARMGTQPGIWLGILLLGRGIYWLVSHREKLQNKDALVVGIFWGVAMMTMQHASFMILVMLACLVLVRRSLWLQCAVIGGVVVLLNANWLFAGLLGYTHVAEKVLAYTQDNLAEFATVQYGGLGPFLTSLLGYGFWGEKYGNAFIPVRSNAKRRVAGLLLVCLGCWGWWSLFRSRQLPRALCVRMGGVALISVILGVGIASDVLAPAIQRLYDHVPGYRGLREPHKRIGVYMMLLLPCIISGRAKSAVLLQRYREVRRYIGATVLVCFARTPGVMQGMMGKYAVTDYPQGYAEVRSTLLATEELREVTWLHLPRHSYHQCAWTDKVIANSLRKYFAPIDLIVSDNIEIGELYSNSTSSRSQSIETFIRTHDLGYLKQQGIGGILFTPTCADFMRYDWVAALTGLQKGIDTPDMQVFVLK